MRRGWATAAAGAAIWGFVAGVGVGNAAPAPSAVSPEALEAQLASAHALERSGKWQEAGRIAADVAKAAADPLMIGRAETIQTDALIDGERFAEALPHSERAIQLLAAASSASDLLTFDQARMDEGELFLFAGKLDAALKLYTTVLAREQAAPGVPPAQLLTATGGVGTAFMFKGENQAARPYVIKAAEMARAELKPGDDLRTSALNNAVFVALALDDLDEAQVWLTQLLKDCPDAKGVCDRGTPLQMLGAAQMEQGLWHDAERTWTEAANIRLHRLGPDSPKLAESLTDVASMMKARGAWADALLLQQRAAAIFSVAYGPYSALALAARLHIVDAYIKLRQFDRADALLNEIQVYIRVHPLAPSEFGTELVLHVRASRLRLAQDKPTLALDEAKVAMGLAQGAQGRDIGSALDAGATALRRLRRPSEAIAWETRALALNLSKGQPVQPSISPYYLERAAAELDLGDDAAALTDIGAAQAALPFWLQEAGAGRDLTAVSPSWSQVRIAAADLALKALWATRHSGDPDLRLLDRAFQAAQAHTGGDTGDALAVAGAERFAASQDVAQAARAREAALHDLRRADKAVAHGLEGNDAAGGGAPQTAGASIADLQAAEARFLAADADLQRKSPRYANLRADKVASLDAVRRALRPDEALIFVVSDPKATNVFTVTPEGALWTRAPIGADALCRRVAHLRAAMEIARSACETAIEQPRAPNAGPAARGMVGAVSAAVYDRRQAYSLWRDLFGSSTEALRGRKRLIFVTDGPLATLPVGALVLRIPNGPDGDAAAERRTDWWVKTVAVSLLPEPRLLPLLRQPGPVSFPSSSPVLSASGFVGVGAPCRGPCGAVAIPPAIATLDAALAQLPLLPGAASELHRLANAASGSATLILGPEATERRVLDGALADRDVIAFATHSLARGQFGAPEPALVLSLDPTRPDDPGLLTASTIAQSLSLKASWVILSACDTAAADDSSVTEAYSGLSRAFFAAGARALLVSYAPVADDVAERLTAPTLDPRLSHAEALRRAQLRLLSDRSRLEFANPKTWAVFAVVGDGD